MMGEKIFNYPRTSFHQDAASGMEAKKSLIFRLHPSVKVTKGKKNETWVLNASTKYEKNFSLV